jgi:hypothetical protein
MARNQAAVRQAMLVKVEEGVADSGGEFQPFWQLMILDHPMIQQLPGFMWQDDGCATGLDSGKTGH